MRNFEEISTKDPSTADGVIMYICIFGNRMKGVASTNENIEEKVIHRFFSAMELHLKNREGCFLTIEKKNDPTNQWDIVLTTSRRSFEIEFSWFIECLRQTRVIKNPIISDLTKHPLKLRRMF